MKTAAQIRNLQQQAKVNQVLVEVMDNLEEYAKEHPNEYTYEAWIYEEEKFLDDHCIALLQSKGYEVYHNEVEDDGTYCKHQHLKISWDTDW